jgi:hypothetical protein
MLTLRRRVGRSLDVLHYSVELVPSCWRNKQFLVAPSLCLHRIRRRPSGQQVRREPVTYLNAPSLSFLDDRKVLVVREPVTCDGISG